MITLNSVVLKGLNVQLDEVDVLTAMLKNLGLPDDAYVRGDAVCHEVDTSYHGSPCYEEVVDTRDPVTVRRFTLLNELLAMYPETQAKATRRLMGVDT